MSKKWKPESTKAVYLAKCQTEGNTFAISVKQDQKCEVIKIAERRDKANQVCWK